MATFVLVHGAWLGAWCWDKVVDELKRAGHSVLTPELPGHGQDQTPVADISLDSYVQRVSSETGKVSENVVLVGHSMGGVVVSQVAEQIPGRISSLIYVSAIYSSQDSPSSKRRSSPEILSSVRKCCPRRTGARFR